MSLTVLNGSPTTTADGAAGTSHTVNLPTGIQNGELLVIILATVTTSPGTTTATGWTFNAVAANGTASFLQFGFKHATGAEGSSVTVTTTGSMQGAWITMRVGGPDQTASPAAGTASTGSSTNPTNPSLTPAWGAWDTFWIVACSRSSATVATAAPASFTNLTTIAAGTNSLATAILTSRTATESPGAWTAATASWVSDTWGVKPASNPLATNAIDDYGVALEMFRQYETVDY